MTCVKVIEVGDQALAVVKMAARRTNSERT